MVIRVAGLMVEISGVTLLDAARAGDQESFQALTDPYRYELRVHCYRIVGSLQDAEDLVQETMLRAWRRLETFEERASIRAWLYKIATNACLDALDRQRRLLPQVDFPTEAGAERLWLEPCPDDWFSGSEANPEARYSARESTSLAFLVALQLLPPRQRAILILRDVLDWQASEAAVLLDTTVSAVNNALRRARATLQQHAAEARNPSTPDDTLRPILDRYVRAWEAADIATLITMLKEDAVLAMPPLPLWFAGREAVRAFFAGELFPKMGAQYWRFRALRANGQPAFAAYAPDASGRYQAHSIHILRLDGLEIAELVAFSNADLFRFFGLPAQLDAV
jgi:RNA polymerase sigma-70 factor (ECF subfamily)